jgi:DNA-binding MarR family transcriptional regulator
LASIAETELSSWMRTLVDYVRSGEPDLTNRQMALLLVVYLNPGPHTVRGLARVLNVSKPVVTRALNRLGALGYLRRQRDDQDKRNIFVARTSEGADFLEEFGQFIGDGDAGDGGVAGGSRAFAERTSERLGA